MRYSDAILGQDTLTRYTDKIHWRDTRTLTHFGTTWMSFIPANRYQSSDYTKHSKPSYPKKHRTWLSVFYATIRVSTTYTISLPASCSSFFCFHVNLFLTFPWAKVRNRKTRQYVTAETLTRHLQSRYNTCNAYSTADQRFSAFQSCKIYNSEKH